MPAILRPQRFWMKPLPGTVAIDWAHPCARRLEAFYLLNDTGNLVRELTRGRNGTPTSATRTVQAGVGQRGQSLAGGAWDFGGTGHLIDCGTFGFDMTQGVTIECWSYHDTFRAGVDERYVSKADGTGEANHDWMLGNRISGANRNIRARMGRMAVTAIGATNVASRTAQWIHSAARLVATGATTDGVEVFLDGVEDGENFGGVQANYGATASAVYLGNQPTSATSAPDGRIGLVAVWSRALQADEIAWRYREPFAFLRPVRRRTYVDFAAGGGGTESPADGSSSITFAASAGGASLFAGTASSTLTFSPSAASSSLAASAASSTLTFSPSGASASRAASAATSSLTFAPSGTGASRSAASASSSIAFTPSAAGAALAAATASSTLTFGVSGSSSGAIDSPADGSSSLSFTAAAVGASLSGALGASSLTFAPSGIGAALFRGSASSGVTFAASGASAALSAAAASSSLTFSVGGVSTAEGEEPSSGGTMVRLRMGPSGVYSIRVRS